MVLFRDKCFFSGQPPVDRPPMGAQILVRLPPHTTCSVEPPSWLQAIFSKLECQRKSTFKWQVCLKIRAKTDSQFKWLSCP